MDIKQTENKLNALKIPAVYIKSVELPFYTDHYFNFNDNITINKIKARKEDINALFNNNVDIIVNNGFVVFRIAKKSRPTVNFTDFIPAIKNSKNPSPLAIGLTDDNKKYLFDLVKMPHLLVTGATGSGKSVFLNNCIMSLIYSNKCELILIDIKRVEFNIYENISCLKHPIVNDVNTASHVLDLVINEMMLRYDDMEKLKCRTFDEYRKLKPNKNYICVVIDELADLLMQNKKDIEPKIIRLAQLARASGIHLILATQRPSSDVITGLIKANIPSKICFSVSKSIDSMIAIDQKGAEKLNGNGDGLFKPIGRDIERIQSAYISTPDLIELIKKTVRMDSDI